MKNGGGRGSLLAPAASTRVATLDACARVLLRPAVMVAVPAAMSPTAIAVVAAARDRERR
ncbi:MAG: hypothetical protein LC689_10615 [Myxococcales bacterium]|nr:hypothetical protein [Myxococcales bacterium]